MTEMLKDLKFYGIVAGYFAGLTALILGVHTMLDIDYISSCLIGFVLSGFILIGIALLLIKDDKQQNKVTEYNFEESTELLED